MIVLTIGCILAACDKNTYVKPDFYVTFDYNEGDLTTQPVKEQYLGVMKNGLISVRPGYSVDKFPEASITGYYLEGWYTAKTDENGEPIVDERGFVQLDKKWDFETQRVNENITLYANLLKQATMYFVDRTTGEPADTTIMSKPGESRMKPSTQGAPKKAGYTFFGKYYQDKDGSEEFKWPYVFGTEDITVYVDFIEGENWNFVYTAADFISAFSSGSNIYLMNDLEFTEDTGYWAPETYFNGVINGRGYTVSGLRRNLVAKQKDFENKGGIFGILGESAHIYDITFADVEVSYTAGGRSIVGWYVGFLAWKAEKGAKIENVTVNGTLTYGEYNGGVTGSNWIAIDETNKEDVVNCDFSQVVMNVIEV